jgi:hypothetical protein
MKLSFDREMSMRRWRGGIPGQPAVAAAARFGGT